MTKYLLNAAVLSAVLGLGASGATAAVFADKIDWSGSSNASGWDATIQTFTTSRSDPGNALGAPDQVGNSGKGFLSLGRGGAAVFGFATDFEKEANVFEVTFNCDGSPGSQNSDGACANWPESADIYVGSSWTPVAGAFGKTQLEGAGFAFVTNIPNGDANTPGGVTVTVGGPFTYLALVDTSDHGADGFDVDAVSVSPVPLPAAGLALLTALGGAAAAYRRTRKAS